MTQVFDRRLEHLSDDIAFAVKNMVIVDLIAKEDDECAKFELRFDFKVATQEQAGLTVNAVEFQRRRVYRLIVVRRTD